MVDHDQISNKYVEMTLHARGENLHDTLTVALNIVKAYGARAQLEFPQGYSVVIWPSSTLNDIKKIEELENRIYNLKAKLDEKETASN